MKRPITFGEIPGIGEGTRFKGRKEMMQKSFHRRWGGGIDGNASEGASAIVLNGGYEDDQDLGDEIIYTGAGGNDPNTGQQIDDQTWKNSGNAALLKSHNEGLPVRVIRGKNQKSIFSPNSGYSYAGLYSVVDAWIEKGKSGFDICRFRLLYDGPNKSRKSIEQIELNYDRKDITRRPGFFLRIIRDTKKAREIKKLYQYECQICGISLNTKAGKYAEGAHIKPLGKPHDGDDNSDNILCLCPNHHVMLDKGSFSIADDLSLLGELSGTLRLLQGHKLNKSNLQYHRKSHGYRWL